MCFGQPDKCERQCKCDVCSNPLTAMATSFLRSPDHRWSRTRGRHGQPFSQRVLRKCTMPFVLPTIHRRKARHVLRTARQVQATVHMWPVCSNPLTAMRRTRILEQPQAPEDLEPEDLKDPMVGRSVAGSLARSVDRSPARSVGRSLGRSIESDSANVVTGVFEPLDSDGNKLSSKS